MAESDGPASALQAGGFGGKRKVGQRLLRKCWSSDWESKVCLDDNPPQQLMSVQAQAELE